MTQQMKTSRQSTRMQESSLTTEKSKILPSHSESLLRNSQVSTRQIVIKTNQPEFPLITILRVEKMNREQVQNASHMLARITQQMVVKRLHIGFTQLTKNCHSSKIYLVQANRLAKLLEIRQNRLKNQGWLKLQKMKSVYHVKLNSFRFLLKAISEKFTKAKSQAFLKITQFKKQGVDETNLGLKEYEFSDQLMEVCKKMLKFNIKSYPEQVITQLDPCLQRQLKRFQKIKGSHNNQSVLIVLNNNVLTIKNFKKEIENQMRTIQDLQRNSENQIDYDEVIENIKKADGQIRRSLEKNKKVEEKEIKSIIERQIQIMTPQRQIVFYDSRLFLMALVIKLLAARNEDESDNKFMLIIKDLEQLLKISNSLEQLKVFNKQKNQNQIVSHLASKFIEFNSIESSEGVRNNLKEEIKYISEEVKIYVKKYNHQSFENKGKLQIFTGKRDKKLIQFNILYSCIKDLIDLIGKLTKQIREKGKDSDSGDKVKTIYLIIRTFLTCLQEGSYEKWQSFLNGINRQEYKQLLDLLDQVNDILVEKIEEEGKEKQKIILQLQTNEKKMQTQLTQLKRKNGDLEKKMKEQEKKKSNEKQIDELKRSITEKTTQIKEWERKYEELQKGSSKEKLLEKKNEQLARELKKIKQQKQKGDKDIKNLDQQKQTLQRRINQLENQMKKTEETVNESINQKQLEFQIEDLNKKLKEMTEKYQKEHKNFIQIQNDLKNSKSTIETLTKQIEERENENKSLTEENIILKNRVQEINERVAFFQNQIQEISHRFYEMEEINTKQNDEYIILQNQLNKYANTIQSLKLELEQEQRRKSEPINNNDNNSKLQNENWKKNEEVLKRKISELEGEVKKRQNQDLIIRELERERNQYKEELSRNQSRSQELIKSLNLELERIRAELTKLKEEITKKQQEKNHAQILLREKEGRMSHLELLIKQKQNKITILTNELNINKERQSKPAISEESYKRLSEELERVKRELNLKNNTLIQVQNKFNTADRQLANIRTEYELKIRNLNEIISLQERKEGEIIRQLNERDRVIEELNFRLQNTKFSINYDNVVFLVGNILTKYSQIQVRETPKEREERVQRIFSELQQIKNKFGDNEEEFYINTEKFAVDYVRRDIGLYRAKLIKRIEYIEGLRERLQVFLNNEIQMSKQLVEVEYQFEICESSSSTALKTERINVDSPLGNQSLVNKMNNIVTPKRLFPSN